jgi:hypothetical protein
MKFKQVAVVVVIGLFATTVWSSEAANHRMKVEIIEMNDGEGETRIEIDGDDLDFDLHEMQVGENRSIVDKDGRSILITRGEDNFTFDVDGKTIEMPAFGGHRGHGDANVWVSKGDFAPDVDFDVRVMHDGMAPRAMGMEGVMIISKKEIDDATQRLIRTALESAGHESVHFAGGHEGGRHQVHVIKEVVEVSE